MLSREERQEVLRAVRRLPDRQREASSLVDTAAELRSTQTGAVLAEVTPPKPYVSFTGVTAAADDRTFVVSAQGPVRSFGMPPFPAQRFFLLRIDQACQAGARMTLTALPAGYVPPGHGIHDMALSPDGTQLAADIGSDPPFDDKLYVFDLATGTERAWSVRTCDKGVRADPLHQRRRQRPDPHLPAARHERDDRARRPRHAHPLVPLHRRRRLVAEPRRARWRGGRQPGPAMPPGPHLTRRLAGQDHGRRGPGRHEHVKLHRPVAEAPGHLDGPVRADVARGGRGDAAAWSRAHFEDAVSGLGGRSPATLRRRT